MNCRVQIQLAEATGEVNRWHCSKFYGREVSDAETLVRYFVKSGGAKDFAKRYAEALGEMNRWFCSEFYGRQITDEEVLWDYYLSHRTARGAAAGCVALSRS